MRTWLAFWLWLTIAACASLPGRDPLVVDIAGIESLPSESMEIRLSVAIRIQNPNDAAIEYRGAALDLDINGRRAASGVSDTAGTVPRYGETVIRVPVTISAFNIVSQIVRFAHGTGTDEVSYRVRGKLESGLFGARRFSNEGTLTLALPRAR